MNIKKSIQLTTKPLEELLAHKESLDFRLDEEAWKDLKTGDHIEFWEDFTGWDQKLSLNSRKAIVEIAAIYKAPTFKELFNLIENNFTKINANEKTLEELRVW